MDSAQFLIILFYRFSHEESDFNTYIKLHEKIASRMRALSADLQFIIV